MYGPRPPGSKNGTGTSTPRGPRAPQSNTASPRLGRQPGGGENVRPTVEERARSANANKGKGKDVQRLQVDHLPPPAPASKSRSRSPLTPVDQNLDSNSGEVEDREEWAYRMVLEMCQTRPLFYMRWPSYWEAMLPFLARVFGYKNIDTKAKAQAHTNTNLPSRKDLLAKFEATKIQLQVTRYVVKCCEPNDNYVEDDAGAELHREFLLANLRAESKEDAVKRWKETFRTHHKEIFDLVGMRYSANGY